MASELARKTAEIASRDVGQRETDGKNNSPRIREYLRTVKLGAGYAYCAAAISCWIQEASQELGWGYAPAPVLFHKSARALGLVGNNPGLAFEPWQLEPEMVPCIGVIDTGEPGGDGHAFLIVGMDDQGGLQTIEANTNLAGSRDGQGVFVRQRQVSELYRCVEIR